MDRTRRYDRIGAMFTREEKRVVALAAHRHGLSMSRFVRESALWMSDQDNWELARFGDKVVFEDKSQEVDIGGE